MYFNRSLSGDGCMGFVSRAYEFEFYIVDATQQRPPLAVRLETLIDELKCDGAERRQRDVSS